MDKHDEAAIKAIGLGPDNAGPYDGGPAYPSSGGMYFYVPKDFEEAVKKGIEELDRKFSGMTLRDYFAAKAMQAMAGAICQMDAQGIITHRPDDVSQISYVYADAMLAERAKK